MLNAVWDARCRRCGRCCFEKIENDDRIYYTDIPCEHLDLKTRQCIIYSQRHLLKPECLPLSDETLEWGILPDDCPYISHIENYNAPQLVEEEV